MHVIVRFYSGADRRCELSPVHLLSLYPICLHYLLFLKEARGSCVKQSLYAGSDIRKFLIFECWGPGHFYSPMKDIPLLFPPPKPVFPEVIVNAPKWKSRYLSIWKQWLVLNRLVLHLHEDELPSICPGWLLCIHNSCGSAAIYNRALSFLLKHLKRQNYSFWNIFYFVKNRCSVFRHLCGICSVWINITHTFTTGPSVSRTILSKLQICWFKMM